MALKYIRCRWGDGSFYESSKQPAPGFTEKVYTDTFTKEDKITYVKEYKDIFGLFVDAQIRSTDWGQQFSLVLQNDKVDGEYFILQLPVENQQGAIDTYLETLIRQLVNMKRGEWYSILGYTIETTPEGGDKPRVYRGISVADSKGEKVEKSLSYVTEKNPDGDIPAIEWSQKRGKWKADHEKRTDFLYNTLSEYLEKNFPEEDRVKLGGGEGRRTRDDDSSPVVDTPQKVVAEVEEDDSDDLPF